MVNTTRTIQRAYSSLFSLKIFVFSKLDLTDNKAYPTSSETWEHLGVVGARVFRVHADRKQQRLTQWSQLLPPSLFIRGVKKQGVIEITLRKPIEAIGGPAIVAYIDPQAGGPYVKLQFLSRPRALLQALGIIPCPPLRNTLIIPTLPLSANRRRGNIPQPLLHRRNLVTVSRPKMVKIPMA